MNKVSQRFGGFCYSEFSENRNNFKLRCERGSFLPSLESVPGPPRPMSMLLPSMGGYELGKGGPPSAVAEDAAVLRSMILRR